VRRWRPQSSAPAAAWRRQPAGDAAPADLPDGCGSGCPLIGTRPARLNVRPMPTVSTPHPGQASRARAAALGRACAAAGGSAKKFLSQPFARAIGFRRVQLSCNLPPRAGV